MSIIATKTRFYHFALCLSAFVCNIIADSNNLIIHGVVCGIGKLQDHMAV